MNRCLTRTLRTASRRLPVSSAVAAALLMGGATAVQAADDPLERLVCLGDRTVAAGETWVVPTTLCLRSLSVAEGATVAAPGGYYVTLTVNRVETGQKQVTTAGTTTTISPGTYAGRVVLTVTVAASVLWPVPGPPGAPPLEFPIRQALRVDATGVNQSASVLDAVVGGRVTNSAARNITVRSRGEGFNGIWVDGAPYTLEMRGSPSSATAGTTSSAQVRPSSAPERPPGWSSRTRRSTTSAPCGPGWSPPTAATSSSRTRPSGPMTACCPPTSSRPSSPARCARPRGCSASWAT